MATVLLGLVSTVLLVVGADLAGAHDETGGELTVTRLEQSGPGRVSIEVGIVHGADGHIADTASVTVTLSGPAGDTVGPVQLEQVDPNSSLFAAEIEVPGPGSWAVTVDATEPEATLSTEVDVIDMPEAPTDDATTTTVDDTATTEVPADDTATDADEPLAATTDDGVADSDNRWLLIGAALAAVALVAIVTFALRRNGAHEHPDDELT